MRFNKHFLPYINLLKNLLRCALFTTICLLAVVFLTAFFFDTMCFFTTTECWLLEQCETRLSRHALTHTCAFSCILVQTKRGPICKNIAPNNTTTGEQLHRVPLPQDTTKNSNGRPQNCLISLDVENHLDLPHITINVHNVAKLLFTKQTSISANFITFRPLLLEILFWFQKNA